MTLTITQVLVDQIVEHAQEEAPNIACGMVVGPVDSDWPKRLIRMRNAANSPTFWEFDGQALLTVYRKLDELGEEIVAIYRSSYAEPTKADAAYAPEDVRHHLYVFQGEVRSFQFEDGGFAEEEVVVNRLSRRLLREQARRHLEL
jgi:proteasome lid subunit RPN8/RPN11